MAPHTKHHGVVEVEWESVFPDAVIDWIFVPAAYRGYGLGKLTLKVIEAEIKKQGHRAIYIHPILAAEEFWRKMKYVPIKQKDAPEEIQKKFDRKIWWKKL